jgi:hypothetical protein
MVSVSPAARLTVSGAEALGPGAGPVESRGTPVSDFAWQATQRSAAIVDRPSLMGHLLP